MRAAINRRGVLSLTQEELAKRAGVSAKTVGNFEAGRAWPNARTLGQIERLGLNWPVGKLRELADDIDYPDRQQEVGITQEQADILVDEIREQNALLRQALDERREQDALELADELSRMLENNSPT